MRITLNGDVHDLPGAMSVAELLLRLNLDANKVAVELNRKLLRGDRYETRLAENDAVEILTFVGGG